MSAYLPPHGDECKVVEFVSTQCIHADAPQIGAEMQRVAEQAQHAANLREAVGAQRRRMGSIDAATVAENQA